MLAATDKPANRTGFGPMPAGFEHVAFGNLNALRDALGDHVAAVMIEPVQGEGGARDAHDEYLRGVREAADEFGVLVIADEVQSGIGRTGTLFAYQTSGIRPDIIAMAKGLGGGFPVGAVIASARGRRRDDAGNAWLHLCRQPACHGCRRGDTRRGLGAGLPRGRQSARRGSSCRIE